MTNNWIEWNGGEQPVPNGTLVDVELRDGELDWFTLNADALDWQHPTEGNPEFSSGDIVRYRIHAGV